MSLDVQSSIQCEMGKRPSVYVTAFDSTQSLIDDPQVYYVCVRKCRQIDTTQRAHLRPCIAGAISSSLSRAKAILPSYFTRYDISLQTSR